MGKYSSDSDNDKHISRNSYKRNKYRSSSSSSSDSRDRRRKRKSRSCDKYSRSKKSRSSSPRRRGDRSRYRDRVRHHRSRSRSKRRSRSRSYIREYTTKSRRHSSSSSSSSSSDSKRDLTAPIQEYRKSPETSKIDTKIIDAINDENFTPKTFTSNKNKKVLENIVIDLKKQTIKIPEVEPVEPDSIFHHTLFLNEEARMEKWIKELYGFRQRALQQGLKTGDK